MDDVDSLVCLGLRLHVPFWCSFRDPLTSNLHRTFPVPPPSTLYGLLGAALGLAQDDVSRRADFRFAIAVQRSGEIVETYSKWMKASEDTLSKATGDNRAKVEAALNSVRARGELPSDDAVWSSTPLIRQKLIQPIFDIGVLCSVEHAEQVLAAVARPAFPLYLGESDDGIDIEALGIEVPQPSIGEATGIISGVHAGGILANLPRLFRPLKRGWELERWLVTVPRPGAPVPTDAPLHACHGHKWEFEPPIEALDAPQVLAGKSRSPRGKAKPSGEQGSLF